MVASSGQKGHENAQAADEIILNQAHASCRVHKTLQ